MNTMTDKRLSSQEKEIRLRLRDDFLYYSQRCLTIATKEGKTERLKLNKAQLYVHARIEEQIKLEGKCRALILKGRQQGVSTYIQARLLWKTTHRKAVKAFILTHSHAATSSLYGMTRRYYDNLPLPVKPSIAKNNSSELDFAALDSGYRVSTAASTGVGRGSTITYFHGSEVAYWANGEEHIPGILQAIPDADGTEVLLESTAAGPDGLFYKMCIDAYEGKNDYQLIFVPWFWSEEYATKLPIGFEATSEELNYQETYKLTLEQIHWRRKKIAGFVRGIADFRREYPATVQEAFTAEAENALWTRKDFENITYSKYIEMQDPNGEAIEPVATAIGFDPAGSTNASSDESGIVAATLMSDGKVYVTHDQSGKYPPDEIVTDIKNLYYKIDADRLTIETNFGGNWVTNTFEMEDPNMVIYKVHARKGKRLRAEPVAHAYRQAKIVHVGDLTLLEDEMTTWEPYNTKAKSPNRIDALVYAITDLLDIGEQQETPVYWSTY